MATCCLVVLGWSVLLWQVSVAVRRDDALGRHHRAYDRHTSRTAALPEAQQHPGAAPVEADSVAAVRHRLAYDGPLASAPAVEHLLPDAFYAILRGIVLRHEPAPSVLDAILNGTSDDSALPETPLLPQRGQDRSPPTLPESSDATDVAVEAGDATAPSTP